MTLHLLANMACAPMQAPLQVYARMLAEKAQQQRALQRADAVEADREDASSEDEEAAGKATAAQPSTDMGEVLAASARPLAKRKPSRAAPLKKPSPQVGSLRELNLLPSCGVMIAALTQNS